MATRFIFTPFSAEFPASAYPDFLVINRRPVLSFNDSSDETVHWAAIAPQGLTGTITVIISYFMASATSGTVGFQAQIEAITDGDSTDLDATTSFDTVNNSASTTVPGTAGYMDQISITMTNADSLAAGDYFRLLINRDANGSAITDSASGNCYLLMVELRDSA